MLSKQLLIVLAIGVSAVLCQSEPELADVGAESLEDAPAPLPPRSHRRIPQEVEQEFATVDLEPEVAPEQPVAPKQSAGFGSHFKGLANGLRKGFETAYQESKPAIQGLHSDINQSVEQLRKHQKVQDLTKRVQPGLQKIADRAGPILDAGNKHISGLYKNLKDKHQARQQARQQQQPQQVQPTVN